MLVWDTAGRIRFVGRAHRRYVSEDRKKVKNSSEANSLRKACSPFQSIKKNNEVKTGIHSLRKVIADLHFFRENTSLRHEKRSEKSGQKSKNKISGKLRKTKIFIFKNSQECQFQVYLNAVFGDRTRSMSEVHCAINWKFFWNKILRKLKKNKNFYFWKLSGM